VAEHGVERGDDLAIAGGESDLFVLAGLNESFLEPFDVGV
jgi:hypothetical protein